MAQAFQPDPRGDWLRMFGGVLIAVGATVLFARKTDDWAAFPLLLVVAIPCAVVFGFGAMAALATGAVARWHAVLMVAGVLLSVLAFGQLWDVVGVNTESAGFGFLLFVCVTALAAFGSFRVGAAYQALLAGLAGVAAFALRRRDAPQAPELVTAAGIAGVLVGVIGVAEGAGGAIAGLFFGVPTGEGEGQSFVWDVWLLLFSLALVAYGAAAHARGPAYVAFFGLLAFAIFQGAEVNARLEGEEPDGSLVGWPLILLLVGTILLAAGIAGRRPPPAGARVPAGSPPPEPETTYDVRS
jgi:hypothetical protein